MLVLLFVALRFAITSLGEKKANLSAFLRLFDLCLFGFVGFLFLLVSGICDCGSPWTFLLPFFYSTRRFVLSFAWFYFVLLFFNSLSIAITSLG